MRATTAAVCLLWATREASAVSRRPLAAAIGADGRIQDIPENLYPRDWIFTQKFDEAGNEKWRRDGSIRVTLHKSRLVKFHGNGSLRGIWNHKTRRPQYLEIELPLDKKNTEYLVYRVTVRTGKYFNNALQFEEGEVRRVTTEMPAKEITRNIGTFTVKPVVPRPMVDRSLQL
mmetsp:Transcript_19417/g.61052  ORF Transcript_19417/g.61052 Transcript_19417/m.61052 type:complete len:173 (+) Transcript_19417:39-557(+)